MTSVAFLFVTPTGEPITNTTVEIQLSKSSIDPDISGITLPRLITAVTDKNGEFTVDLWPSDVLYYVTCFDTESDAALNYKFYVPTLNPPNTVVRLQDIVVVEGMSPKTYDEVALLAIHDAKANAITARIAADEDAIQTGLDRVATTNDAATALAARDAAQIAELAAATHSQAAALSELNAYDYYLSVSKISVAVGAAASAATFATQFTQMATNLITTQAIVVAHHGYA